MKISHRNLEYFLTDPQGWLRARQHSPVVQLGYDGYLRLGIHRFHRTQDANAARAHLEQMLDRAKRLKSSARKAAALNKYDEYVAWVAASGTVVADSKVRLDLSVNVGLNIGGEVHRIDITSTGYRGILFGVDSSALASEIRFPLLQLAISKDYSVPLLETAVGVQQLDGSGLDSMVFSRSEIDAAVSRFTAVVDRVRSSL